MSVPTPPSPRSPGKMFLVLHTHSYSFYTIDTTVFRRLGLLCPDALLSRSAWKFKSVQSCPWPMTDHSTRLKAQNASSMWYKLCKAINTPDHREASGWWEGFLWNCIQVCLFSFSDFLSPYQYFNKSLAHEICSSEKPKRRPSLFTVFQTQWCPCSFLDLPVCLRNLQMLFFLPGILCSHMLTWFIPLLPSGLCSNIT